MTIEKISMQGLPVPVTLKLCAGKSLWCADRLSKKIKLSDTTREWNLELFTIRVTMLENLLAALPPSRCSKDKRGTRYVINLIMTAK